MVLTESDRDLGWFPSLLVSIYYVVTRQQPYHDLGPDYFDERDRVAIERHILRRLGRLNSYVGLVLVSLA